jgi:hypothetical protein
MSLDEQYGPHKQENAAPAGTEGSVWLRATALVA